MTSDVLEARLNPARVRELMSYCENRRDAWARAGQVHGRRVTDDAQHCETTALIYTDLALALRLIERRRIVTRRDC